MQRFMMTVEYDGTLYHGWQLQKDVPTVQFALERVLERLFGTLVRVHGAGRTDAGVHARGQVAHFTAAWRHAPTDLQRAVNALLPSDVVVRALTPVPDTFHARHSARIKTYVYTVRCAALRSPLQARYALELPEDLEDGAMNSAAKCLIGMHDFASFGLPTEGTPSTVREILAARWDRDECRPLLRFTVTGTGFLRYMVRNLVGTMLRVGRGKISADAFRAILEARDHLQAGPTAPPHGLCLESVEYGDRERYSDLPGLLEES